MELPKILNERPIQENVVAAYPYDDGLLSFFHNSLVDSSGRVKRPVKRPSGYTVPYYNRNLFPPGTEGSHGHAAAVSCLFENIIVPPRPVELPDVDKFTSDDGFKHPDLRLEMPFDAPPQFGKYVGWNNYGEDDGELYTEWEHLRGIAFELRTRRPFQSFFNRYKTLFPDISYVDFTINTIVAVHLARKHNAVLLGNDVFHEFYGLLRMKAPASMELFPEFDDRSIKTQQLNLKDLEALSLFFAPATIDAFAAVRMDKRIREYGKNWRRIISTSAPAELRNNLMGEMAKAYQYGSIAAKANGVLSMIGTFLTWVGFLVPGSDLAGKVVDLLDKGTGKIEQRLAWRLIGAKMQQVAHDASLAKFLSEKMKRKKGAT